MFSYIEEKAISWANIQEILRISAHNNHWTNLDQVTEILQAEIAQRTNLHGGLQVIACSSGTSALHTLVNMHSFIKGRILRWAVSSYGFSCTQQGPLQNATIVDCDQEGMLDLDLLNKIEFDGIVVTNIFGSNNLKKYHDYCKEHNKVFIGDSALALDNHHYANEIISLHHTKPWGMGEGGVAIIEKNRLEKFKSLTNSGLLTDGSHFWASNCKMSDLAAAFVIHRLRTMSSQSHREQFSRIARIAGAVGYKVLGQRDRTDTPASVPLLAPCPLWNLENPYVKLQKYYRPLDNSPVANDIYSRMVNFPCHPGIEPMPNEDVTSVLTALLRNTGIAI